MPLAGQLRGKSTLKNSTRNPVLGRLATVVALVVLLASCSGGSGDDGVLGEAATSSFEADSPTTVEELGGAAAGTIESTVTAHPTNTLLATVEVMSSADVPIQLVIEADGIASRTMVSKTGTTHNFEVSGLRAETTYRFTAYSSAESSAEPVEFTTGALPSTAPTVEITQPAANLDSDGITFVGLRDLENGEGPAYYGFDGEGHIVWYLDSDQRLGGDPYIRHVGNGEIIAMFNGLIQQLSLSGEVLSEFDVSRVDGWHHDVRLLEDGGLLLLTRETRTIDGEEVLGDVITELDADGINVWEWSTFDHLDTTRFPSELSTSQARASGLDWTHANALWASEESAEILISLRNQGWVVSVNWSSGAINWIAGDEVGTAEDFDATFLDLESGTWTSGQHAPMFTDAGELLVYDNRNETGGETDQSRAVVYAIDAEAGTANQVFEALAGKYTSSLGDVDELANGNILINAGGSGNRNRDAMITEVNRSGGVVWQATLPNRNLYRTERVTWAEMSSPTTETIRSETTEDSAADATDITNVTLTATDASCAAYAGDYSSDITDVSRDLPFEGSVTLGVDGDVCILETNSIPNHDVGEASSFANDIDEVTASYQLPINPEIASEPTEIGSDAAAVILLNGVVWESFPAACFDFGEGLRLGQERIGCPGSVDHPWRYNIGSPLNEFGVDVYFAHPQGDGYYHYHKTPIALYDTACEGVSESPVIGFAKDGFPVFGPCFSDENGVIRTAESGYNLRSGERQDVDGFTTPFIVGSVASTEYDGQFVGDFEYIEGSGDLDECNGMTVDGVYGYYLTETYPFVVACYSGTPTAEADFGRTR